MSLFATTLTLLAFWSGGNDAVAQSSRPFPNEGLSCRGNLVQVGDGMQVVLKKCGQPQRVEPFCRRLRRGGQVCWNAWVYVPSYGAIPRHVAFENGVVIGIALGSIFDRKAR